MNFYKSDTILDTTSIKDLKDIIDNAEEGCTVLWSDCLDTQDAEKDDYYKDFIGGADNNSPLAFLLFKLSLSDSSLHQFFQSNDYILQLMVNFYQKLFLFNSTMNVEKKDISLYSGTLSHIYFYDQQDFNVDRNTDISIFHEDIGDQCRILISLPRATVCDSSNWNTIVGYDQDLLYRIIVKRVKDIVCSDSQTT